jgi:hypothetical protein
LELLALLVVVGAGAFLFDLEADKGAGSLGAAAALVVREEEPVRPWSMALWMALSKLEVLLVAPKDADVVFSSSSSSSSADVLM